jgi:hypothetical protein
MMLPLTRFLMISMEQLRCAPWLNETGGVEKHVDLKISIEHLRPGSGSFVSSHVEFMECIDGVN